MIKLIAFDLDGTLLNDNREINPNDLESLKRLVHEGKKILFASGRPYTKTIDDYYLALDVTDAYYVSYNGEAIYNTKTKELIYDNNLSQDDLLYIYPIISKLVKGMDISLYVYLDNDGLFNCNYKTVIAALSTNQYTKIEVLNNQTKIIEVDSLTKFNKCHKFMLAGEPSIMKELIHKIPKEIQDKYEVTVSMPCYVEILKKGINKYQGMKKVLDILNIQESEVMAFGDSVNDIEMLIHSKIGVAMGNSKEALKEVADYVTLSNNDEGITKALNKFI